MLKKLGLLSALVIGFALSTAVNASVIYATDVTVIDRGEDQGTTNGRDNENNLLDATDGDFYELGRGGSVVLTFGDPTGQLFGINGVITEVTFGKVENHPESVDVFASIGGGVWELVASVLNTGAQSGISFVLNGPFDALKLVDTTTFNRSGGFDVDSVGVRAVPAPAGIFLLGVGIIFLGLRKRSA